MTSRPGQLDLLVSDAAVADPCEHRTSGPPDSGGVIDGPADWPGGVLNHLAIDEAEGSPLRDQGATGIADEIDVQRRRQPATAVGWIFSNITPRRARATPDARFVPAEHEIRSNWTAEEPTELQSVLATDAVAGMPSAAWAITEELLPHFDGVLPERLVHGYVTQAVSDLAGSISIEALPEMAIRLASVRLHNLLGSGQTLDTQVL